MNGSPESWDAAEKAVMEALLSDRGLQNLVDVGARALGNPLVVVDPGHRYLACGGEAPDADDGSAYARVMREELAFGDILEEGRPTSSRSGSTSASPARTGRSRAATTCWGSTLCVDARRP